MPLIIISGVPSSGKTFRSSQLISHFTARIEASDIPAVKRLKLHHITDESLGVSRDVYHNPKAEKDARAAEMSAVKRLLGRDSIVVADGLNYIKGFRYQLFCEAKAVGSTSCVVHIGTPVEICRQQNAQLLAFSSGGYPEEDFENLVFRYEEPNGMNRWDSPLFTVLHDDESPPYDQMWEALIGNDGKGKVVKPNLATVLKQPTAQNYLYDLDKTTSEVVSQIQTYQADHPGEGGGEVHMDNLKKIELPTNPLTLPQLQRIRRQFISLNRQHEVEKGRIKGLFVDYLNDSFQHA